MISIATDRLAEELTHPLRELEQTGFLSISGSGTEVEAEKRQKKPQNEIYSGATYSRTLR